LLQNRACFAGFAVYPESLAGASKWLQKHAKRMHQGTKNIWLPWPEFMKHF